MERKYAPVFPAEASACWAVRHWSRRFFDTSIRHRAQDTADRLIHAS